MRVPSSVTTICATGGRSAASVRRRAAKCEPSTDDDAGGDAATDEDLLTRSSVSSARTSAGTAFIASICSAELSGASGGCSTRNACASATVDEQADHVGMLLGGAAEEIAEIRRGKLAIAHQRRGLRGDRDARRDDRALRRFDQIRETNARAHRRADRTPFARRAR